MMKANRRFDVWAYISRITIAGFPGIFICLFLINGGKKVHSYYEDLAKPIVYEAAKIANPAKIVLAETKSDLGDPQKRDWRYFIKKETSKPGISSLAYLAADIDSGDIILEKNRSLRLPMASITKLMTAIVSLETVNQFQNTTIPLNISNIPFNEIGRLKPGQKIQTGRLIYPMLLESSNVAAEALADFIGRKNFVGRMNEKASAVGLIQTRFEDPSGASPGNVSTAEDIFKLASYIYENKKYIFNITKSSQYTKEKNSWFNNNHLHKVAGYLGGKTGFTTAARETVVSLFSLPVGKNGETRNVAIILLRSDDRENDVLKIKNHIEENYYFSRAD